MTTDDKIKDEKQVNLINMNVLQVKKYYHLIKKE